MERVFKDGLQQDQASQFGAKVSPAGEDPASHSRIPANSEK
jgi:hypothetical protein